MADRTSSRRRPYRLRRRHPARSARRPRRHELIVRPVARGADEYHIVTPSLRSLVAPGCRSLLARRIPAAHRAPFFVPLTPIYASLPRMWRTAGIAWEVPHAP